MGHIIYDYRRKDHSQACVPWLQLKGHWLEPVGIKIGAPISVGFMEGCLVLVTETGGPSKSGSEVKPRQRRGFFGKWVSYN